MVKIIGPEAIEDALFEYHSQLASTILHKKIKNSSPQSIVEIGSGPGTFTIPLLMEDALVLLYRWFHHEEQEIPPHIAGAPQEVRRVYQ